MLMLSLLLTYVALSAGMIYFENWRVLDGFYFGMEALTTVGFGEFTPTNDRSKILCLVLIPFGIALGFGAGFLLLQDAIRYVLNRRNPDMITGSPKEHTIVCGYGRVGEVVVRTLEPLGIPTVVIELNPDKQPRLEDAGLNHIIGSALDQEVLSRAGLEDAATVVSTFENDAQNVYLTLEVRDRRPDISVVATASNQEAIRPLRLAGATRVISPSSIAGEMLAKSAVNPDVIDILTEASDVSSHGDTFGQVAVQEGSWLVGQTLSAVGKRAPGALVMMVKEDGKVRLAPGGSMAIREGMVLAVVGRSDSIRAMSQVTEPEDSSSTL